LTDDQEIDDVPDWSPDGRTVIFTSGRDGEFALWAVPSAGGRRQKLNDGGYAPRFSPDGSRIAYWNDGAVWIADPDGTNASAVANVGVPVRPVWTESGPAFFADGRIQFADATSEPGAMWPEFDAWDDGAWLVSAIEIDKTELWSLDLTFTEE
jgi:Tol biopolymer transport system component